MTGDRLALRGWMPPEDGKQTNFHDEVKSTFIQQAHPVVAVFRGKPGSDRATFIPDPLGDEPQIVTGVDLEEFAMIRLHKVQLAAGAGRQSWDDGPTTAIALPKPWLRQRGISPSAASLVWVKGDSMEPTLKSGAMVMINHNRRDPGARRIYAFRQGDDLRVKRLEWLTPEQLLISSDNPAHKAELLTQPDMDDLEIIGEVVWSGANVG
jgi:phage repressor protein C with HTH and peptisase S24 domain